MGTTLEQRIAAALSGDIKAALAELLGETEAAIDDADTAAEEARTKALDPLASPDVAKARSAMENAAFIRDRLRNVLPKLQAQFKKVCSQEAYDRWTVDYENVKLSRDAAAEQLKALYPQFVAKITDLLLRIEEIGREVRRVNISKPFDAEAAHGDGRWLREVELEARDMADSEHCCRS